MTPAPDSASALYDDAPVDSDERTPDLHARVGKLALTHTEPVARGQAFLEAVSESLGTIAGVGSFSDGSDEHLVQQSDSVPGSDAWIPVLQSAALEARSNGSGFARMFGSKTAAPEYAVIASPLDTPGADPLGGVAVLARCTSDAQAERIQVQLRSACILVASLLARPSQRQARVEMDDFARIFARAAEYSSDVEFAYAMTNAARQRFNCEQTALGFVRRGRIRVACISGLDQVKHRSPGVHLIEQAMGECADLEESIVEQSHDSWGDNRSEGTNLLHARWRGGCAGAAVASIPILSGERVIAVLSMRRRMDDCFDDDELTAVQALLAPMGSALELVSKATQPLPAHTVVTAKRGLGWLMRRESITRKVAILATLVTLVAWALAPSTFKITTPARIVAEHELRVAAPLDATILEVFVRDGDVVEVGQPLLQFDTAMLQLELDAAQTKLQHADSRMNDAIANGDPGEAGVLRAERAIHQADIDAISARMHSARLVAPVAGVITGERLSDLAGQLTARGDALFSIVDLSSLRVEIDVPESRVTDVRPGASMRFASHARPEEAETTRLERVATAGVVTGQSVSFPGQSPIPEGQHWLRPGMEGVAEIDCGEHSNWWIATHRLLDAARLRFWID